VTEVPSRAEPPLGGPRTPRSRTTVGGLETARSLPPHEGGGGNLATLGPVSTPRALANSDTGYIDVDGGNGDAVFVYGDASQH